APAPPPTPTPAPPTPTVAPTPTLATKPNEIETAFLSNLDDLIAEATDLAVTPCDELVVLVRQNPTLVGSMHGFAATLKRASTNQTVLNTDNVKAAIVDLDHIMGQLDGALSACGIPTPPP